ncbi:MAG: uroporphyrinogen decarboxylase family protein [Kiritimatiellia bacterium]
MTNRERTLAILRYQPYDRMPVVHFGYWYETLEKWVSEGHLRREDVNGWGDGNAVDIALNDKLGFDFGWQCMFYCNDGLQPAMADVVVAEFPDGTKHVRGGDGVTYLSRPGAGSIPAHVDYLLKDRAAWEEHYKWRYQWQESRVNRAGLDALRAAPLRENPFGLHCGSLYGNIRNILTVEGSCYLQADDNVLFAEIIATVADICYRNVKVALESGAKFDFAHFWEDICFKNGPLITPSVFEEVVGPHYKRITDLTRAHGLDICSLDCDGLIDALIPTWFQNGVNTMFPIEVGTWNASIQPWREKYGKELRGVGGMNKTVFAHDRKAVDAEIERLKPLIALGGYIPCPDHRIAPDAKWDNVRYYCDRMRSALG